MVYDTICHMLEHFHKLLDLLNHHYILLTSLVWITYCYSLKTTFVSDDHQGIGEYDGNLQTKTSQAILAEPKLSNDEKTKKLEEVRKKNIFIRLLDSEYGMISRWLRYHIIGGGNYPSTIKLPNGVVIPDGKLPAKHHLFNILIFNISVILGYNFLSSIVGPKVALITFCLFSVSPLGTQTVAWISGLGYPLSLMWIFIILNFVSSNNFGFISSIIVILLDFMAINALFVALALPVILLFLGFKEYAILTAILSIYMGSRIVRETIKMRADAFKEQDMGHLTKPRLRRIILAFKTAFYYLELCCWPNRLGLYHEWGNKLDADLERADKRFFISVISVIGILAIAFLTPYIEVRFGIIWFFSFIFIFLNWITIQQFVTERYLWIPSIGFYLIVAFLLQDYHSVLFLIGGILICRTWLHLPTYDDELRFYLSNTWNFQKSEVALANLGCTWIRLGNAGSALDTWHASAKANPDYDVPLANIFFHYRSSAMFDVQHGNYESAIAKFRLSLPYIEACNKCTIQHFKDNWAKELKAVRSWIDNPLTLVVGERKRLTELKQSLVQRKQTPGEKDIPGIDSSLVDIENRFIHIEALLKNVPPDKIPSEKEVMPVELTIPGQPEVKN